jgi:hypothetical protein
VKIASRSSGETGKSAFQLRQFPSGRPTVRLALRIHQLSTVLGILGDNEVQIAFSVGDVTVNPDFLEGGHNGLSAARQSTFQIPGSVVTK